MSHLYMRRLQKEFRDLKTDPPAGIELEETNDLSLCVWPARDAPHAANSVAPTHPIASHTARGARGVRATPQVADQGRWRGRHHLRRRTLYVAGT